MRQGSLLSEVWNALTLLEQSWDGGHPLPSFWYHRKNLQSSRPALRTTPATFSFFNTVSQVAGGVEYWAIMRIIVRKLKKCEQLLLSLSMGFPRFERKYVVTHFSNHQI